MLSDTFLYAALTALIYVDVLVSNYSDQAHRSKL